jgi:Acetyltransferase (GNAT) domain
MTFDPATLNIKFETTYQAISPEFWEACYPAPLEGYFWYKALEESKLEDQFTFYYGVISYEGNQIGIIPCFIHNVPLSLVAPDFVAWPLKQLARVIPQVGYQRTFFIGSVCSDSGTIGLRSGYLLRDFILSITQACEVKARELKAPMIVFKDFEKHDSLNVSKQLKDTPFFTLPSYPGTRVVISEGTKESYIQNLSSSHRHNLLKKLKRSKEILPLKTQVITSPSTKELEEIFKLFQQTYEKGSTKFERLELSFFEQISLAKQSRFILQREESTGKLVTFMLGFVIGKRFINKFIGLDYSKAGKTYLYFRLFEAAVETACAEGLTEIQSGQTGYRAKLDLGHQLIPLYNFVRHQNKIIHFIYKKIGTQVTWKSLDTDLANYLKAHPEEELTSFLVHD